MESFPVSVTEVTDVVKKLQRGEVPKVDEFHPELLKARNFCSLVANVFLLYPVEVVDSLRG